MFNHLKEFPSIIPTAMHLNFLVLRLYKFMLLPAKQVAFFPTTTTPTTTPTTSPTTTSTTTPITTTFLYQGGLCAMKS